MTSLIVKLDLRKKVINIKLKLTNILVLYDKKDKKLRYRKTYFISNVY